MTAHIHHKHHRLAPVAGRVRPHARKAIIVQKTSKVSFEQYADRIDSIVADEDFARRAQLVAPSFSFPKR